MKKYLTYYTLIYFLSSVVPAGAACVMGLDGADKAITQNGMTKHVFAGQHLKALVAVLNEMGPFELEPDTTSVWLIEVPEAPVGIVIEVSDKCVTFKPQQVPAAVLKHLLVEVSRRMVGA